MKRLIISLLILFWIATIGYITLGSKQLSIKKINIKNHNYINKNSILSITNSLKNKHISSILFTNSITKQLKKKLPQIENISYKIVWPSTLNITIHEKKEWGIFIQSTKDVIVAMDGTILNNIHPNYHIQKMDQLIIIKGLPDTIFKKENLPKKIVHSIQDIRNKIESFQKNIPIQYQFNKINELSIIYNDEVTIKLGKLEHIEKKFTLLNQFLKINTTPLTRINYIDLRIPSKVVINYALES